MTGSNEVFDEVGLDALFDAARAEKVVPSTDLLARIVEDAVDVQPKPVTLELPRSRGWIGQLSDALGGWPAVGGLITATVAGVYIGIAQPALVGMSAEDVEELDYVSTEFWLGDDMFFEEG